MLVSVKNKLSYIAVIIEIHNYANVDLQVTEYRVYLHDTVLSSVGLGCSAGQGSEDDINRFYR